MTLCVSAASGLIYRLPCKDNVDMETFQLIEKIVCVFSWQPSVIFVAEYYILNTDVLFLWDFL